MTTAAGQGITSSRSRNVVKTITSAYVEKNYTKIKPVMGDDDHYLPFEESYFQEKTDLL